MSARRPGESPSVQPGTVRPSADPPGGPPPLIAPTGHAKVDALGDVVNAAASPFRDPPPEGEGTLGAVSRNVTGALGVVGAAFSVLDTGVAMVTSFVAAALPAFPAVTIGAPYIGPPHCHAHPPSFSASSATS